MTVNPETTMSEEDVLAVELFLLWAGFGLAVLRAFHVLRHRDPEAR